MRTSAFCLAMTALVAAPAALASTQPIGLESTSAQTAQPAVTSSDPNEIICKSSANETGSSLLRRRVCMSRTEWQQMENENRAQITDLQTRSLATAPHQ